MQVIEFRFRFRVQPFDTSKQFLLRNLPSSKLLRLPRKLWMQVFHCCQQTVITCIQETRTTIFQKVAALNAIPILRSIQIKSLTQPEHISMTVFLIMPESPRRFREQPRFPLIIRVDISCGVKWKTSENRVDRIGWRICPEILDCNFVPVFRTLDTKSFFQPLQISKPAGFVLPKTINRFVKTRSTNELS